jgi:hypothetical protein
LTVLERKALKALIVSDAPTMLPADKGNATMVLDTAGYCWRIAVLLEDEALRKLKEVPH